MAKEKKVQASPPARRVTERSGGARPARVSATGDSGARDDNKISLIREPERKTEQLLAMVRALAVKQQRSTSQPFISLRDAARRFDAPVSRMAEVYRRLSREGILTSVRGSRTILRARGGERTVRISGLIGMPVSLTRLTSLHDYRRCFTHLRDALHHRGFMVAPFFFEQREVDPLALVEKLKADKVDAALWLLPDGETADTAPRLRDAGIPFAGIDVGEIGGGRSRYEVRRERALRAILRDWRRDSRLERVAVVRASGESTRDEKRLPKIRAVVEEEGFDYETAVLPPRGVTAFLKSLCDEGKRVIILPGPAAAVLAWRGSVAAHEVLARCRVALLDGPIELLPTDASAPPEVDIVTADWAPIAHTIAQEIATGRATAEDKPTAFDATHQLRVPATSRAEL